MGIFRSMAGSVQIELTSADTTDVLQKVNEQGILISDIRTIDDVTVSFVVSRPDLDYVYQVAERKEAKIRVLARIGIIWTVFSLKHRMVLLAGLLLLLVLCSYVPTRVLLVEVEGNRDIPANLILEAAQNAGIRFGASRRAVRSEKMKNQLLAKLPQLQWAGVNTYGCRAVISVKERAAGQPLMNVPALSNIVASCDGVVTSCTVTSGTGLCGIGQAVRQGQTLISGYTDCGGVMTAGRSAGEIYAETRHSFSSRMPVFVQTRGHIEGKQIKISVCYGKKRINFYKGSGISDGRCVKMITQYHLTLPGGYRLPAALIVETVTAYELEAGSYPEADASAQLSAFARAYLDRHMIALTVLDAEEQFSADRAFYALDGLYHCTEMIGREQSEQIGEFHGKAD